MDFFEWLRKFCRWKVIKWKILEINNGLRSVALPGFCLELEKVELWEIFNQNTENSKNQSIFKFHQNVPTKKHLHTWCLIPQFPSKILKQAPQKRVEKNHFSCSQFSTKLTFRCLSFHVKLPHKKIPRKPLKELYHLSLKHISSCLITQKYTHSNSKTWKWHVSDLIWVNELPRDQFRLVKYEKNIILHLMSRKWKKINFKEKISSFLVRATPELKWIRLMSKYENWIFDEIFLSIFFLDGCFAFVVVKREF